MKPSHVAEALKYACGAHRPVMLWGGPGTAKTSLGRQFSKEAGRPHFEFTATMLDPVDLRGLMQVVDGRTRWCPPEFLPDKPHGTLLIEEIVNAPVSVQQTLYSLALDGRLGEYTLPEDTMVIGTGNRETDRSGVVRMPTALANRFIHADVDVDRDDFIANGIRQDFCIEVLGFIRYMPQMLYNFDPKSNEKAFATLRTWEYASDLLKTKPPAHLLPELLRGTVGKAAADACLAYLGCWNILPDPNSVLANPMSAPVFGDDKPGAQWALCGALSRLVNSATADGFFAYAGRIGSEFAMAMVADATLRDVSIKNSMGYTQWTLTHGKHYV
jgi:hypothetical protein